MRPATLSTVASILAATLVHHNYLSRHHPVAGSDGHCASGYVLAHPVMGLGYAHLREVNAGPHVIKSLDII